MTDHDIAFWGLVAQWAGVVVAVLSIGVAALFGALTLRNSRGVRDAQQRASLTAAGEPVRGPIAGAAEPNASDGGNGARVFWAVVRVDTRSWRLRNVGDGTAYDVTVEGYTDLDRNRLAAQGASEVPAGGTIPFTLISRFTLSGPANLVVRFRTNPAGNADTQVVQVPAD